jgi:hypothetical protein
MAPARTSAQRMVIEAVGGSALPINFNVQSVLTVFDGRFNADRNRLADGAGKFRQFQIPRTINVTRRLAAATSIIRIKCNRI